MLQPLFSQALDGLKKKIAGLPPEGPFTPVERTIILPGRGHSLLFRIEPNKSVPEKRILSVTITPPDKSHTTTRYVARGTNAELADYMERTPGETWEALAEEMVGGCDSFYYP